MIYNFVSFNDVAEAIAKNLDAHYADADFREDYGKANLDWENYFSLSAAGKCKVITVEDNGELIAYSGFVIGRNINHKEIIEAVNSGFFIKEKYRGKIAKELIKKTKEYLHGYGVTRISYQLTDERLGRLLRREGFEAKYKIWSIE